MEPKRCPNGALQAKKINVSRGLLLTLIIGRPKGAQMEPKRAQKMPKCSPKDAQMVPCRRRKSMSVEGSC